MCTPLAAMPVGGFLPSHNPLDLGAGRGLITHSPRRDAAGGRRGGTCATTATRIPPITFSALPVCPAGNRAGEAALVAQGAPTMNVFARIFASRKVWIAMAAVAGVVVTLLGADPAKWTPLISSIVALAGVVIAAIGYEDGQLKGSGAANDMAVTNVTDCTDAASIIGPKPNMNAVLALGVLSLLALFAAGCGAGPAASYVAADHATFNAVAPEHSAYVAADPNLTDADKQRRLNTLQTWRLRVEQAERDLATTQPGAAPLQPIQPLPAPATTQAAP
jgi:hypothetical protein